MPPAGYPVTFAVGYPDRPLNRVSTLLRPLYAIPVLVLLSTVSGGSWRWDADSADGMGGVGAGVGGFLFFAPLLMILFRRRYPRWWFDWNLQLHRFAARVAVYLALMDDRYPATEDAQAVRLDYVYPYAARDLNRWLPLVKWLLAVPHYVVLLLLDIGLVVAVLVAWFAILFTGRYPRGLFDYVEGVIRWHTRVAGYALALVTDRYPPFSLS